MPSFRPVSYTHLFGVSELLARLRVLLRRHARGGAGSAAEISFGDVRVDFAKRVVERGGQHVHLTAMEYRLLAAQQFAVRHDLAAMGQQRGQQAVFHLSLIHI